MNESKNRDSQMAALKGIYDSLTDEQKEKAKACRTMDELMAFAGKEGLELPDEVLDAAAGGLDDELSDPGCTIYRSTCEPYGSGKGKGC